MAEKMHHKRVERLKRREKRNKLLNSWAFSSFLYQQCASIFFFLVTSFQDGTAVGIM
jgi:hypothetical protein